MASMHVVNWSSSQISEFLTAVSPPITPITKSEISKIHSKVNMPRRLRFLLPEVDTNFIVATPDVPKDRFLRVWTAVYFSNKADAVPLHSQLRVFRPLLRLPGVKFIPGR